MKKMSIESMMIINGGAKYKCRVGDFKGSFWDVYWHAFWEQSIPVAGTEINLFQKS